MEEAPTSWSSADFGQAKMLLSGLLGRKGHLWKQGEKNRNWRRRWFALSMEMALGSRSAPTCKLFYYENETDKRHINYILIGPEVVIRACPTVVPKGEAAGCGFSISESPQSKRTYQLAAACEDDQIQWVETLRKIGLIMRQRSLQPSPSTMVIEEKKKSALSGKAAQMLAGNSLVETERGALDVVVERASGLAESLAGKRLEVRVSFLNEATSSFNWWEYSPSEASAPVGGGEAEWHADYSFETSGVGAELIIRIVEARSELVLGEARLTPLTLSAWPPGGAGSVPLVRPRFGENETVRAGGMLLDTDMGTVQEPWTAGPVRGQLHLRLGTQGMLRGLGHLADPIPLRLQTGDVLLFAQSTGAARVTRLFTRSRWSHCAVIVRR